MEVAEEMAKKARLLFLHPDHKFHMDFCKSTRSYLLRNPKNNQCHPLELFLIADSIFTGHKIGDLSKLLNKNIRWILGFYHGYACANPKYKNSTYQEGFGVGQGVRTKITS